MKMFGIIPGLLFVRGRFEKFPDRLERLEQHKVYRVVSLRLHADKELAAWIEAGRSGVVKVYEHLHFPDGQLKHETMSKVKYLVPSIKGDLEAGRPVLIHCDVGKNRSAFVAALVVREFQGVDGIEALKRVRAVRTIAISNRGFERYLKSLPAPGETQNPGVRGLSSFLR